MKNLKIRIIDNMTEKEEKVYLNKSQVIYHVQSENSIVKMETSPNWSIDEVQSQLKFGSFFEDTDKHIS